MTAQEAITVQLTAFGPGDQQLRTHLVEGAVLRIGRAPKSGWAVPWDHRISREQADLKWTNGRLKVICLEGATNPIIWNGRSLREIMVGSGDVFRIGDTEFRLDQARQTRTEANDLRGNEKQNFEETIVDQRPIGSGIEPTLGVVLAADSDVDEYSYGVDELNTVQFADPTRKMELLANLPGIIGSSESDTDLALKLASLLLDAIPQAVAVAVVQYDESVVTQLRQSTAEQFELPKPRLMRVQTRDAYDGRFVPSRRLLCRTLKLAESYSRTLKHPDSNVHIWASGDASGAKFTMSGKLNWAFCTPIAAESCVGWCLYVSGEGGREGKLIITEDDLKGDVRFTELLAQFIGSIRQVRLLQKHKTQLSSFFSPKVIQSLTGRDVDDVLKPSERDVTVMFCDVRGFSKKAEKYRDNLHELLNCVRAALSAMTSGILENNGTIADFQGDAALGFWGWPVTLDEGPIPACLAALAVQAEFNKPLGDQGLLEGFSVGIGIAYGRAIAGQIGTSQQAKVGVFGPVVNQGSRVEGMTKQFGVGICLDEAAVEFVRRRLSRDQARVRKLARVRPKGMDTAMTVGELLPPASPTCCVTDAMIERHETAMDAIIAGKWTLAREILAEIPDNGPKQFLLDRMAELNDTPPGDWSGAFALVQK